jgi:hypothetical protein
MLPLLVWVFAIPAYISFISVRVERLWIAVLAALVMACVFVLPSYPFYQKEAFVALGLTAVIGIAIALIVGGVERSNRRSDEWKDNLAIRSNKFALWGIIFFAQIAQPLALHYGLSAKSVDQDADVGAGLTVPAILITLLHLYWVYVLFGVLSDLSS